MELDMTMIKDVVSIAYDIVMAAGAIIAVIRWGRGQKTARARYLKVLIGEYNKDSIQDFCLNVQNHSGSDSQENANEQDFEKNMRKTLLFFSYLCHAYSSGLIDCAEFSFFKEQMKRVVQDDRVRDCLKQGVDDYSALLQLAKKMKWLQ